MSKIDVREDGGEEPTPHLSWEQDKKHLRWTLPLSFLFLFGALYITLRFAVPQTGESIDGPGKAFDFLGGLSVFVSIVVLLLLLPLISYYSSDAEKRKKSIERINRGVSLSIAAIVGVLVIAFVTGHDVEISDFIGDFITVTLSTLIASSILYLVVFAVLRRTKGFSRGS